MKFHAAYERLFLAVESLASNQKDVVNRLENVYVSHILVLKEDEFKSERAKRLFENIKRPVSDGKLKNGYLMGTTDEAASKIAKDIVSLFVQISVYNDQDQ